MHQHMTFPLEIWARIMQSCLPSDLKSLAQCSASLRQEAQRNLYHTMIFAGPGSWGAGDQPSEHALDMATWVRDPSLFRDLHVEIEWWKHLVRKAYVQITEDAVVEAFTDSIMAYQFGDDDEEEGEEGDHEIIGDESDENGHDETEEDEEDEDEDEEDEFEGFSPPPGNTTTQQLAQKYSDHTDLTSCIARLLGDCPKIQTFHMTLPQGDDLPLGNRIWNVTSLSVRFEGELDYMDWDMLRIIFKLPALRHLELLHFDSTFMHIDEDFHNPGISNVTHLQLTDCGPITRELVPLLQWPKDLQCLKIYVEDEDPEDPSPADMSGEISVNEAVETLKALQDNLQELELFVGPNLEWIYPMENYQSHAFTSFTKLRRLQVQIAIVAHSTAEMAHFPGHQFHTNFPPSLEVLVLNFGNQSCWNIILERAEMEHRLGDDGSIRDPDTDRIIPIDQLSCQPEEDSHELFAEFEGLAEHKTEFHPRLRELRLLRRDNLWLDCEHVKRSIHLLEQSGISFVVDDWA